MKLLILIFLNVISLSAVAGFSFNMHRSLLSQEAEHLTATMKLNSADQTCLVDTGARFSIAKEGLLTGLPKVGEIDGGGISNMKLKTDLVETDLTVGKWEIKNATIGRTNRIPFDCLIGNDFFLGRSFSISFKDNSFADIQGISGLEERVLLLNVYPSDRGGHFGFDIQIAGEATGSLFDTGASKTVIDKSFVENSPKDFTLIKNVQATDGNSAKFQVGLYRVSYFKFGHEEFRDLEVYVMDLSALTAKLPTVKAIIGLDLIEKYTWSFDTKAKAWSYEQP